MSKQELTELVRGLKQYNGTRIVVTALWLLLYTALRTIEIRRAEWQQFDFERELWVIPADKMKRRRTHTIPLSRQVQTLLHELHHLSGNGRLLFPNSKRPDDLISATTINRALEYIGARITGHDFRATAATHLIEMGYPKEYIDAQLAHANESRTDATYFHAKFLQQRKEMMQAWADFIDLL